MGEIGGSSNRESLIKLKNQVNVKNIRERFESFTIDKKPMPKKRNVILRTQSTRDITTINHRKRQVIPILHSMEPQTVEKQSVDSCEENPQELTSRTLVSEEFRQEI